MKSTANSQDCCFKPFLPARMQVLSGSALKLLAVISMLCDHAAVHILRFYSSCTNPFFRCLPNLSVYSLMHGFGRIAFPIYAFLLVEGFIHTKCRNRYAVRLAAFAVISEIPWNLEHSGTVLMISSQNVFFTLLMGFIGLCLADNILNGKSKLTSMIALAALLFCSFFACADYGSAGFGFILILFFLRKDSFLQAVAGSSILTAKWKGFLAFIPINMYNGKRGFIKTRFLKYLFYAIYPVHITIIWIIKLKLGLL